MAKARVTVDGQLDELLEAGEDQLRQAIRYAALGSGKRVRPALMMAVAEAVELDPRVVAAPAAALEMVHTFSLVHDDLPALDDDQLRRGRETVHVAFDEPTAILVGDALLSRSFAVLAEQPATVAAEQRCRAIVALANAVGEAGMLGGQMLDLLSAGSLSEHTTVADLEKIHRGKTGALMRVCGELPAIYAGVDHATATSVANVCELIGLMFQVSDDLLDVTQSSAVLGKTAGKDVAQKKLTYPGILGVEGAAEFLTKLLQRALEALVDLPGPTESIRMIVGFVADRSH